MQTFISPASTVRRNLSVLALYCAASFCAAPGHAAPHSTVTAANANSATAADVHSVASIRPAPRPRDRVHSPYVRQVALISRPASLIVPGAAVYSDDAALVGHIIDVELRSDAMLHARIAMRAPAMGTLDDSHQGAELVVALDALDQSRGRVIMRRSAP